MSAGLRRCEEAARRMVPLERRMDALFQKLTSQKSSGLDASELSMRGSMLGLQRDKVSGSSVAPTKNEHQTPRDRNGDSQARRPRVSDLADSGSKSFSSGSPSDAVPETVFGMIEAFVSSPVSGNTPLVTNILPQLSHEARKRLSRDTKSSPSSSRPGAELTLRFTEEMSAVPNALADNMLVTPGLPTIRKKRNSEDPGPRLSPSDGRDSSKKRPRREIGQDEPARGRPASSGVTRDTGEGSADAGTPMRSRSVDNSTPTLGSVSKTRPSAEWRSSFMQLKSKAENLLSTKNEELYAEVVMGAVRDGMQWVRAKEMELRTSPSMALQKETNEVLNYMAEGFLRKTEIAFRDELRNEKSARFCADLRNKLRLRNLLVNRFTSEQKKQTRSLVERLETIGKSPKDALDSNSLDCIRKSALLLADFEKAVEWHRRLVHAQACPIGTECNIM